MNKVYFTTLSSISTTLPGNSVAGDTSCHGSGGGTGNGLGRAACPCKLTAPTIPSIGIRARHATVRVFMRGESYRLTLLNARETYRLPSEKKTGAAYRLRPMQQTTFLLMSGPAVTARHHT